MATETKKPASSEVQLSEKARRLLAAHDRVVRSGAQSEPALRVGTAA